MRGVITIITAIMAFTMMGAEPGYAVVETKAYGELDSLVGERGMVIDSLVVKGPIDESDFKSMLSYTIYGQLTAINLQEAELKDNTIPAEAFRSIDNVTVNSEIRLIMLPPTTRVIEWGAFYGSNLERITGTDSLEIIHGGAFYACRRLGNFKLSNKLRLIGKNAFGLSGVREVILPESIDSIGNSAFCVSKVERVVISPTHKPLTEKLFFAGCKNLEEMVFKEGVEYIPEEIANKCTKLSRLSLPSTLKEIAPGAFCYCDLKQLNLNEGLEEIGRYAFYENPTDTLVMPSTVRLLDYMAFGDLTNLKCIISKAVCPPECIYSEYYDESVFGKETPTDIPVYVPDVEAYRNAPEWCRFTNILPIESGIDTVEDDSAASGPVEIFNMLGERIGLYDPDEFTPASLPSGLYILRHGSHTRKITAK